VTEPDPRRTAEFLRELIARAGAWKAKQQKEAA
jgi:hypothetical protein